MFSTEKFGSGAEMLNAAMAEVDRVFGRGEAAKNPRLVTVLLRDCAPAAPVSLSEDAFMDPRPPRRLSSGAETGLGGPMK